MQSERQTFIEREVRRAVGPLHQHLDALWEQGEKGVALEQAVGLISRLTARLAALEYEVQLGHHKRKSEQLDPKQLALALDQLQEAGLLESD